MKNYKEMADSVFQRSGEIIAKRNQKRKAMYKAASFASCVCLAVLLGVGIFQSSMFIPRTPANGGNIQPGGNPDGYEVQNNAPNVQDNTSRPVETSQPAQTTKLVVNNSVGQSVAADMDVQYSFYGNLPEQAWQAAKEEFHTITGMEYDEFVMKIPEELNTVCDFYSLSTRGYKNGELEKEYKLHDYVFDCKTEDGKQAIIAICTFEKPLRDCIFQCDNPEMSEINGVPLVIHGCESTYMVQFSYHGVNYDIETRNMDLEGLESLLTGLLAE